MGDTAGVAAEHWASDVVLMDGSTAHVRPIRPDDPTVGIAKPLQEADVTRPMAVPVPRIRAVRLSGAQGTYTLEQGPHNVGRTQSAAVPVVDPQVSGER